MIKRLLLLLPLIALEQFGLGQTPAKVNEQIQYGGIYGKELSNYKLNFIRDETINVNKEEPVIIRTPVQNEKVNIYSFNIVFNKANYSAVLVFDEHPLKPKLVTINSDGTQLSELQLLEYFGRNQQGTEVLEVVRIADPTEITITRKIQTWTLNQKGERIDDTKKISITVDKYEITDDGQIKKIDTE